jgi:hypothetical protein
MPIKPSKLIHQCEPQFPIKGQNGYGGEQDGTRVLLSGPHCWTTKAEADAEIGTLPDWVQVHWATYRKPSFSQDYGLTGGWQVVFAVWSDQIVKNECPLNFE